MNTAKIIGLQFGLASPEEIRNGSVALIKVKEPYTNGFPTINGLFDPRMGTLEQKLICPTDGHDYIKCPGYFGHLELPTAVFHVQYIPYITKILGCFCFNCCKFLNSKENNRHFLNLPADQRFKSVTASCEKIKRCGDNNDCGCNFVQPQKYKKDGFNIYAVWIDAEKNEIETLLTADKVLSKFKRYLDDDIHFIGLHPVWSRPEYMICTVLPIAPPVVRPSVKHDAQQRSEDDLTHIYFALLKACNTLQEKINNNASQEVIRDLTTVVQYILGNIVDSKLSGGNPMAQRSGRPLKSIKDRLTGKNGRMRGNLMAKRVDFSARTVITADPNIGMRQLGVPKVIAKNITFPAKVNELNRNFLKQLIINGQEWPGANSIVRKGTTDAISLKFLENRESIHLEIGDIVNRHMLDGDPVIFNRQPSLHKMSMMGHLAKIMDVGNTFRLNLAVTKGYNADFDGDEMNLHMPQSVEAQAELRYLAAVVEQIIDPQKNASVHGIFQDSLVGSYLFTKQGVKFSIEEAMNLLAFFPKINMKKLLEGKHSKGKDLSTVQITNFDILSQIMPPMTLKVKTKLFNADKNEMDKKMETSNHILEIVNGKYIRGRIEKGVLGAGTKGLIQRICNDFGNNVAADFIDNIQNIITRFIVNHGFSVGIRDLIVVKDVNEQIVRSIQ